jgi:hypothetical protein
MQPKLPVSAFTILLSFEIHHTRGSASPSHPDSTEARDIHSAPGSLDFKKPVMPPVIPVWNPLFRSRIRAIVSLVSEIARPRGRSHRKRPRSRQKSRAIRCRPSLARLIESARRQSFQHFVPPLSFRHVSFRVERFPCSAARLRSSPGSRGPRVESNSTRRSARMSCQRPDTRSTTALTN